MFEIQWNATLVSPREQTMVMCFMNQALVDGVLC